MTRRDPSTRLRVVASEVEGRGARRDIVGRVFRPGKEEGAELI